MSEQSRILAIARSPDAAQRLLGPLSGTCAIVSADSPMRAGALLAAERFDGVYVDREFSDEIFRPGRLLQSEEVLGGMPDGVALLDADNAVVWCNNQVRDWCGREATVGVSFYTLMGSPEILGPDFCPFHTALATGKASGTTLRTHDSRYFHIHAAPLHQPDGASKYLIVTVHDVTEETLQQQKLAAIHQAGAELADLTPDELLRMTVEERIDLLKSNILHFTKDLLRFETVEIRLLDPRTGRLEPLLSEGMEPEAAGRVLHARPQHNGVTGFVAATGKSYLCEDTSEDPLYLEGAKGAKSSLTVPLVLHDQVIGTFNVESRQPGAFGESDQQFLEIFGRDVAVALNTLELLVAEKASTAAASVEAIHSAVALPVDEILNDAVNVMERYIGHEPEVVDRLQRILRNARDIKQVIQKVGQRMAPAQAHPQPPQPERPALRGRRVLVVDSDHAVRSAAHALLGRYGCVVETAPDGAQALGMVRNMIPEGAYDAIIADIRLPDMSGYKFMLKLQELIDADPLPLVLMTGFGYDPGHTIVKSRQAGLRVVLYKPFRLDQLLSAVEQVVCAPGAVGLT